MPVLEHHPSTLPRHALEHEVSLLRDRVTELRNFVRDLSRNPDIPEDYQVACRVIVNRSVP